MSVSRNGLAVLIRLACPTPGKLYLGPWNFENPDRITETLIDLNVRAVISLGFRESPVRNLESSESIARYAYFVVDDASYRTLIEMRDIMNVTARDIHQHLERGESVYVHCYAGRSRSPTVVVHYLMLYHDFSFPDALKWVERYRPCVNINEGFVQILTITDVVMKKMRELARLSTPEKSA